MVDGAPWIMLACDSCASCDKAQTDVTILLFAGSILTLFLIHHAAWSGSRPAWPLKYGFASEFLEVSACMQLADASVISTCSLEPFEASLAFNGFGKLVTLHRQPAGPTDGQPVCLERGARHDTALARGYSTAEVRPMAACLLVQWREQTSWHCSA